MHHILRTAVIFCGATLIAGSAFAQREWSVTGQDVPELSAVDLMMQDLSLIHI